ncbi:MAG: zinc-binding alcohol dehydrogenase family protein [Acidobacteria bacterium]|nr:zinc-binding alcohol dehydrogenase family protein [Acidobacteriota bacterium]
MRALYIKKPLEAEVGEQAAPSLGPGEVMLRVRFVGMCGSDLSSYRGKNPLVAYPRIPGHEIAATIESVGDGVPERFQPGMAVTLSPYTSCGKCASCLRKRPNACKNNETLGVQRDGALTDFITVPHQKLIVADGLQLRDLSLVEPLTVGYHAARRGRVSPTDQVLVLGCGAVGLGAIAASAFHGATVLAVDVDDRKLALAQRAGARAGINSKSQNLAERLHSLTEGLGPDVVIEAIGTPETFRLAVEIVAFTGRVVYIGYAKDEVQYDSRLFVQKELDILGSRNALPEDFEGVIRMLNETRFPLEEMVSKVVSLDGVPQALQDWYAAPASISKIVVEL